jgi:acetyl-CoA synthetase
MDEAWSSFYYQHHHLELENLLKQHEAIVDAGVVGIPDVIQREICHAYLCLQPGYSFTDELRAELCSIIAKEYAQDCIPHQFLVVDQMPKTRSGKLSRQLLKSWAIESIKQVF